MKKRALISVYDKNGIVEFANELKNFDYELISTGGTYKLLKENNIDVKAVEEITSFPEVLGGRVKTLHPIIFSGILAEKDNPSHIEEMKKHELSPIDLVIVNLYPFEDTIAKESCTIEEAIEQIDIGGVTLIRAAAKNFKYVNVLVSVEQYGEYINFLKQNEGVIPVEQSKLFAYHAFSYITNYDAAIQKYFQNICLEDYKEEYTEWVRLASPKKLRYGENPHQEAVIFKDNFDEIFDVLHGKELSYNNLLDIDAACNIINEFENSKPACAIVKHGNPSGIAIAENLSDAYVRAFETDTASPFGGIIIFNKKLELKAAEEADKIFTEIILAPDFDDDAFGLLSKKKNRRLVRFKTFIKEGNELKKIVGGYLSQDKNNKVADAEKIKVVTKRKPTDEQMHDLVFANKVVKHTKSNAVVFIKDQRTL
ncbi:MAG: bifunctional phosphoribosylaminoimidazolecarboxamide formyltransferase/IMP cyclohydrolase, partial [Ignavibacteria bacterium]|nr:bifunctional phosphoribosylaminoimidazolecarboxamide formyltransferase/IMP cyclohydrolase [Ignavibacteria bacterium]